MSYHPQQITHSCGKGFKIHVFLNDSASSSRWSVVDVYSEQNTIHEIIFFIQVKAKDTVVTESFGKSSCVDQGMEMLSLEEEPSPIITNDK